MISSLFPQTPQIARLMRNVSRVRALQNQRERKKKKSAVSNYIQRQDSKSDPEATPRLPRQQLVLQNISVVGPQPPRVPLEERRGSGAEEQSAGA